MYISKYILAGKAPQLVRQGKMIGEERERKKPQLTLAPFPTCELAIKNKK